MGFPILSAIIATPFIGAVVCLLLPSRRPEIGEGGRLRLHGGHARASPRPALAVRHPRAAPSSSSRTSAGSPRIGVRYIVGVDGISLFMVVITALLFPIGLLASEKYIAAPREGVHRVVPAARGRDHGDLPLPRPHRVLRVLGAAARPDVLPHPGMGERAARVRGDEVLHLHRGRLGVPARVHAGARVPPPGGHRRAHLRLPGARASGTASRAPPSCCCSSGSWPRSRSRRRCSRSTPGCRSCTPRRRPRARWCWPASSSRWAPTGSCASRSSCSRRPSVDLAPLMLILAVIGIIYGAIVAAMQTDLKRIIAYSSVAHMGFVVLGIFSLVGHRPRRRGVHDVSATRSPPARSSSSSACSTSGATRASSRTTAASGSSTPVLGGLFLVALFAGIGLPGFSGFIGEFLSLLGTFVVRPAVGDRRHLRRDPRRGLHAVGVPAGVHGQAVG